MLARLSLIALAAAAQAQTIHTFDAASGSAVYSNNLSSAGNLTLRSAFQVEYLLVGGGGGGGGGAYFPSAGGGGGGGGGGAVVTGTYSIAATSYSLAVGAGGAAGQRAASGSWNGASGGSGGASTAFGYTASGGLGGYGGALNDSGWTDDAAALRGGASGGGFAGGVRSGSGAADDGGPGGGGASAVGGNGSGRTAGAGGAGLSSSLTGTAVTYGGGGAGGTNWMGTAASGGAGGGGASYGAGTNNLGGGGGGGFGADNFAWTGNGGSGGSGTIVVRYKGAQAATGGSVTTGSGTAAGYTVHTFTSTGNAALSFAGLDLASRLRAEHNGVISGAGNVYVTSPGTLRLSGANTYTGGTGISSGVLEFSTLADGAASNLGAGTGSVGYLGLVDATLRYVGAGAVSSSRYLWIDLGEGVIDVTQAGAHLTLTPGGGQVSRNLRKEGAGKLTLGLGLSSDAAVTVAAGTLELTGVSTSTGAITIGGGTLRLGGAGKLGGASGVYAGGISNADTLAVDTTADQELSGQITGAGVITKASTGKLTLSGVGNTYSGGLSVTAGQLNLNSATALGATAGTFTIGGTGGVVIDTTGSGAVTVANNNAQVWNGDFTFAGTNDLNLGTGSVTLGASRQVTVAARNLTVGGVISGSALGLTKAGDGTLTLSAANTYTGATAVDDGKLVINGSVAGDVTIASGATLGGSGSIAGDLTVTGAHNPGNSPGVQTVSGNATYNAGASIGWELWDNTVTQTTPIATYDQIIVGGNLTFAGTTTLNLGFGTLVDGSTVDWTDPFWDSLHSWVLFDVATGSISGAHNLVIGNVSADSLGATLSTVDRGTFSIQQAGNTIVIAYTPVPEPSTYGLMLGGLALAGAAIRRRRKQDSK